MEIIIHESENRSIGQITNIQDNPVISDYWGTAPEKIIEITIEEILQAKVDRLNYLEILVKKNILNPETVQLSHEFKRRLPFLGQSDIDEDSIIMGDGRILNRRAFTDIVKTARLLGRDANFRFRFPIRKLLDLQKPADWYYSLGKTGESISLLLFYTYRILGGTVSKGVKIPGGTQAK